VFAGVGRHTPETLLFGYRQEPVACDTFKYGRSAATNTVALYVDDEKRQYDGQIVFLEVHEYKYLAFRGNLRRTVRRISNGSLHLFNSQFFNFY